MILFVGPILCLGAVITVYFSRKWLLTFRPQAENPFNFLLQFPGVKLILGALFYLIILPLSYIELLLEHSQSSARHSPDDSTESNHPEMTEDQPILWRLIRLPDPKKSDPNHRQL